MDSKKEYMRNYMRIYNLNKVNCICGSIICKTKIYQHRKSKKHCDFILKQKN